MTRREVEIEIPSSALRSAPALALVIALVLIALGVIGWLHTDHAPDGRATIMTWDRLHARRYVAAARAHLDALEAIHRELARLAEGRDLPGGSRRVAPVSTIEAGRPTPTPYALPDPRPVPLLERARQISIIMARLRAIGAEVEALRPPEALRRTHTLLEDTLKAQARFAAALADWSALPSVESERAMREARDAAQGALKQAREVYEGLK